MANIMRFGGGSCEKVRYTADVNPASGVTYVNGLAGLDASVVSRIAVAISDNPNITNTTDAIYFDLGPMHRKISVADQVTLTLNGTAYAFDVIGFNHDDLTSPADYGIITSTGKAGITFQMHDLFANVYAMNSENTNSGGWRSSAMRTSTMATMRGYLPAAWQTVIKPVNKVSGTGGGSSSGTETVSDSCFLLAEIEIFGSTTHSVSGEGTQYAYYKTGNSKAKKLRGQAYSQWERSPYYDNDVFFCFVYDDGTANRGSGDTGRGVAFGFCV